MGCVFGFAAGLLPRLGVLFFLLARPHLFTRALGGGPLLPVLGVIFLPFTMLMYVMVWRPSSALAGSDWFWLAAGLLLDVASIVISFRGRRLPVISE